jgi:NADH-quinone oxidoreductase subunit N
MNQFINEKIIYLNKSNVLRVLCFLGLFISIVFLTHVVVQDYLFFLPEFILINFVLAVITVVVFFTNVDERKDGKFQVYLFWSLLFILLLILVFMFCISPVFDKSVFIYSKFFYFNDHFYLNWPTYFFKIIAILTFSAVLVLAKSYCLTYKFFDFEFVLIMLLAFIGSLLLISSSDFLLLYVAVELQALAFYALAAFRTNSILSAESAIKYFILGALASIFWLWGASLIYGATGLTNFFQLNKFLTASFFFNYFDSALFLGLLLFFFGILFKLGVAPFHIWLPDVYQGVPLIVTAFFSTVPKISLIFVLIKFYFYCMGSFIIEKINIFGNYEFSFQNVFSSEFGLLLILTGLLSIFLSSFIGIGQHNIKRLFAYSSIGNTGFIILSIGSGTIYGIQASLIYLMTYLLLTINLFSILVFIKSTMRVSVFHISHFSEINSPVLGLLLSLNLFSLAGIPPLIGFYSKFFVYLALLDKGYTLLTIIISILTIFSTFYYVRLVSLTFFIPSLRGVLEIISVPSKYINAYFKADAEFALVSLILLTSLFNIFLFFHVDYLVLFSIKFVVLFF